MVTDPRDGSKWCFVSWPFGFGWSPYAMQRFGEPLVQGVKGGRIYMDDLMTGADSLDEMEAQWRTILERCRQRGVFLNPDKTFLFRKVLNVLGHRVEAGKGYAVLPSRAKEIVSMPAPTNVKELQSVIGVFTYVAGSIPRFGHRIAPLRALLTRCLDDDHQHGKHCRRGGPRPSTQRFP